LNQAVKYISQFLILFAMTFGGLVMSTASPSHTQFFEVPSVDSPVTEKDTLKFPIQDRVADKFNENPPTQFDLKDPANIKTEVEYDPALQQYSITEKVGDEYYRAPTYMSYEEFLKYQASQDEEAYFKKRSKSFSQISKKSGSIVPKVNLGNALFDRIFGGNTIEVKPQGNVELFFGGNWQNVKNPTLVQSAQKYGIFDFDMNLNINLMAKIGEKMRMNFNYNSKATFDFENQLKLEYNGQEDDIIRKLAAGYISFPLKTSLIQGVQSLFGLKTELQFGRLRVNAVVSQQKSKKESLALKSGSQSQTFSIPCDNYEDFRHFLLAQPFRRGYNKALQNYPVIQSLNNINRLEVWVTNRSGTTDNARDVVAFQDLGEPYPYRTNFSKSTGDVADNNSNTLYSQLVQSPGIRDIGTVVNSIQNLGLKGRIDFEKTFARKLNPSEYNFNPRLGFVSINTQLQPDDVVGIAMEYTNNGKVYQVGEFSQNLPPDSTNPKVLFLKMLKSTSPDPTVPIWDLMMKNIYSLGTSGVSNDEFILNIMYLDPGGGEKRYLPDGPKAGIPLLTLLNLDRLNNQNDPQPDGRFDYVEGVTIQSQQGKIIFPVLEPFGEDMRPNFGGDIKFEKKYLYTILYDSTKNVAIQFPQYNRFLLKGSLKSSNSSEIYLGGFNIPQGSVTVTAGGAQLTENVDYTIDYGSGKLKIINTGVLNSGIPINVSYENNATFGAQQQNFMGTRLDYYVNDNFSIGGTMLRLSERPYFNKVTFGEDPIKNTVLGLDANFQNDVPSITRFIDKLPIVSTTAPSMVVASGEVARIIPGHSRFINDENGQGNIYVDDFEGTRSAYDLKFPVMSWALASTPQDASDKYGAIMFPEASRVNDYSYGKNRARAAWYNLDPCMVDPKQNCMPDHLKKDTATLSNHYLRLVQQQDVFPLRSYTSLQGNLTTLDLAFYPKERGPYNFDATNITANGELLNPQKRWGGIMRPIDFSDFETSNVEFIEFWVMDPFIKRPLDPGGSFYINLGNISEDILKDSRKFFENGLPYPVDASKVETTKWSKIPKFQQQLTPAFDNDLQARKAQDVGYDGMDNADELALFNFYLNDVSAAFGNTSQAYLNAQADPSGDDYHHFRGSDYDNEKMHVLRRYRAYNNPQGNSPVIDNTSQFSNAFTNVPESEDINRDNTLNENEQYFQYRIDMKPNMDVGTNYIINKQVTPVRMANGVTENETWYQFKIPIREYTSRVGGIPDFKSIRFMRMYLTGFQDSVIMRFARLELGRNTWRKYNFSLKNPGEIIPDEDDNATLFNLYSVSLEENSSRSPIPYVSPPGIARASVAVSNGQNVLQNEQSLSIQVCNLDDGNSKGAFKSLGMDLRQFKELKMFIHAEAMEGTTPLKDGDLRAFIRLGSDFVSNYYEYQIPLKLTPNGSHVPEEIWPVANELNLVLSKLVTAKQKRNTSGISYAIPYETTDEIGNIIRIIGNPNLGDVKMAMLGINNPKKTPQSVNDDGGKKCAEVWFNELRLSNMDESGGYAAMGKMDVQLADIGTVKISGLMHTAGYGNIDQKVNQRYRDNFSQFDVSTNINAGKFLPKKWGVQLPVFAGYSQTISNPIYDPYDLDITFKEKVKGYSGKERDSVKKAAQDFTAIKSLNFQNVRIAPTKNKRKEPWDFQNFDMSYSYTQTKKHNALVENDQLDEHHLSLGYTYAVKAKSIEPFKKLIPQKRKYFQLLRDFNFNLLPSNFTMRNSLDRTIGETQVRNIDEGGYKIDPNYFKFFTWNRNYNFRWDLTKSLSFDYTAANNARVDEPQGRIDTKEKKDTFWNNVGQFGRTTNFNQGLNANYNVPLSKFPLLDWTTLRGSYNSTYIYTAASLLATSQGNTIGNTQNKQINGEMDFTKLYNKVKILKTISSPAKPGSKDGKDKSKSQGDSKPGKDMPGMPGGGRDKSSIDGMDGGDRITKSGGRDPKGRREEEPADDRKPEAEKEKSLSAAGLKGSKEELAKMQEKDKNGKAISGKDSSKNAKTGSVVKKKTEKKKKGPYVPSNGVRVVGNLLMMVKRASFTYSENQGTTLPGFMDHTQYVGINTATMEPGLPFAFGYQPDRLWLEGKGQDNVMSRDSLFNAPFQQQYTQTFNVTANVEPFKDFRIDLNLNKTFNKAHAELFKDTLGGTSDFIHLNPYETGGFSISYIAMNTLFQKKDDASNLTKAFSDFENNRKIISNRLGIINPYTAGTKAPEDQEYAKGYTRYSQEVLIPAFLAAYSGKDARTYPLLNNENSSIRSNPFKNILPMPNWRVNYSGLSRTKMFKDIFQSFTLNHAYTATLSMNSFTSALMYRDVYALGFPSFIDSISHNYVPYFMVPNITINENFGPLIGVDMTFKNSLNFHVEFKKSRILSMSLVDFQLSETKSSDFSIGGGMRIKNVTIPTPYFGLNRRKSDVNIKADFGLRDDYTTINRLDQRESRATRGQKVITIAPSIDYMLTDNVTLRFFYDRRQSIPYVSNQYPITTTRGGVTIRFMLGN
jgi:cell surface protein SprA